MNLDEQHYEQRGFLAPFDLLSAEQCLQIMSEYTRACASFPEISPDTQVDPATVASYWEEVGRSKIWFKSAHTIIPSVAEVAAHPELLNKVSRLLGPQFVLWGAQIIRKRPGEVHQFHTDIETRYWNSVNVWLGLENCGSLSSIMMISHSHTLDGAIPPQSAGRFSEGAVDSATVLRRAQALGAMCELVRPALSDGQAFIFNGAAWHGSENSSDANRTALLLQYSVADECIRMPMNFTPPIHWHPCPPPQINFELAQTSTAS
ncbi:phytanoyl-CoA dioxygenase family protein [Pseudomonas amygdali]|uniref:phytanoyl-CoA dioxygenase family protein n=1 Tax=Pseudomonas amygdali TaxID=47877 RepID=UPI001FB67E7B|nr:phytanoyl-CoA dioxygenase family protein [Pseudomonas amygdali]UPT38524.1 phytanoyl-CoA dioxygenase family protein [Pseudomonas amygdali pv. loropetali]